MSAPTRLSPVPRWRVLGAIVVLVLAFAAMIWMVEQLRHPLPTDGPAVPELDVPASDPREEVVCEDPPPREGLQRQEPSAAELTEIAVIQSNQLYDCPQTHSERVVRYRGEVVGAVLRREHGVWVQLNDDVYARTLGPLPAHRDFRGGNAGVGVLLPHSVADEIRFVGGPRARGDVLEVVGVFHRVDPQTHEVSVIRAGQGELVVEGERFDDPILIDRLVAALILLALALGITAAERVRARRRTGGGRRLGMI
ncbi:MAG TPA: hypothetical protein VML96_12405 [Egibacteraceae bacterium]|nr:hypothetical protein [Egibacteraceae bacterium]